MDSFFCWSESEQPEHRPEVDEEYYGVENWQDKYKSSFAPTEEELDRKYLTRSHHNSTSSEILVIVICFLLTLITFPISIFLSLRIVRSYEKMVVMRLGHLKKVYKPGVYLVLPCIDKCSKVDMRAHPYNIDKFQTITADKGIVEVGAVARICVEDPVASVCCLKQNKDFVTSLVYTLMSKRLVKERIADLTQDYKRQMFSDNAKAELNGFIQRYGIEIKELSIQHFEVVKSGENHATSVFNTLVKSDLGSSIMGILGNHLKDIIPSAMSDVAKNPAKVRTSSSGDSTVSVCSSNTTIVVGDEIDIVQKIRRQVDAALVNQVGKCYQIMCADIGNFYVDLSMDCGYCDWGIHSSPHVIFTLSRDNLYDIIEGRVTPTQAYLNGTVSIKGSMFDAIKLKYLADRVSVHV